MIRIALIGRIGSGKTFISNLFGYPVFNAAESVSKIYSNNKKIFYKLKKKLPKNIMPAYDGLTISLKYFFYLFY